MTPEELKDYCEKLATGKVLETVWPDDTENGCLNLKEALEKLEQKNDTDSWDRQITICRESSKLAKIPIVAVLGELNGGKSSAVASLLDKKDQDFVLIGGEDEKGTHRFVYWLPASWEKGDAWDEFVTLAKTAHKNEIPERLDQKDPIKAAKQQNAGWKNPEKIKIPLVGFSKKLDELKLGLLDCPDFQTGERKERDARLDMVKDAAEVSSAFLVVWKGSFRQGILSDLLDKLRQLSMSVPLKLLKNALENDHEKFREDETVSELSEKYGLKDNDVYAAYNFRIDKMLSKAPFLEEAHSKDELPHFFSLHRDSSKNEKEEILKSRLLRNIGLSLEIGTAQKKRINELKDRLDSNFHDHMGNLKEVVDAQWKNMKGARKHLVSFCRNDVFRLNDEIKKIVPTPKMTETWNKCLRKEAPFPFKVLDSLKVPYKWIAKKVNWRKEEGEREKVDVNMEKISSDELAEKFADSKWAARADAETKALKEEWRSILNKFQQYLKGEDYDEDFLRKQARKVWEDKSFGKSTLDFLKETTEILVIYGVGIGTQILIPDPTGTTVSIVLIPITNLLGGITGAVIAEKFADLYKYLQEDSNNRANALCHLACDAFSLQRDENLKTERRPKKCAPGDVPLNKPSQLFKIAGSDE
jgi:hypothetical protein